MRWRSRSDRDTHNRRQRQYFEATVKPTMVPTESQYLRRHVDEVLRFVRVGPGDRVLEIGCGMGRYTLLLARDGVSVEGLDLSTVLLDRLRGYNVGRVPVPLHAGDVADPPPELLGRFDVALGFFVLHHVQDLEECLAGVARVVRPGGRMAFLEPNAYNPLFYVQIAVTPRMTWAGDGGLVRMRPGPVFRAMARAGFRRVALRRFGFFPPLLANRRWGRALERQLERVPVWRPLLPFQVFRGERP